MTPTQNQAREAIAVKKGYPKGSVYSSYRSSAFEYETLDEPPDPEEVRRRSEDGWERLGQTSTFKRRKPRPTIITRRRVR